MRRMQCVGEREREARRRGGVQEGGGSVCVFRQPSSSL